MRLQELFHLVNHACDAWVDPVFDSRNVNGKLVSYHCKNAPQIVSLIDPLKPFPEIRENIDRIYSTHDTFYKGLPGPLTVDEKKQIESAMNNIKQTLLAMQSMCIALGLEQNSSGFDIKLPPNITLTEFSSCLKDLDHVFSQCPLLKTDSEEIKFSGIDIGSMWLTFTIICTGAAASFYILNNLAAMVDKVITIREHVAVLKQQEALVKQTTLKDTMLETVIEANKSVMMSLIEEASDALASEHDINNPEDIERIRGSITMLKEWIDKGMEVYAAIEAPDEIRAVFPPVEMQKLPEVIQKSLQSSSAGEEIG